MIHFIAPEAATHDELRRVAAAVGIPDADISFDRGDVAVLVGPEALALCDPIAAAKPQRWRGSLFVHDGRLAVATLSPTFIQRGQWAMRTLLMGDVAAAASLVGAPANIAAVVRPPRLGTATAGPTLALDIETTKNDTIDFLGLMTDGATVEHIEATTTMWQQRVQHFVDAATTILAHNAKFDVTRLEKAGVRFDRSRIVDTQLAQAMIASDLDTGLDDTAAFNLPGRQVWWKGLGDYGRSVTAAEREHCRRVWGAIVPQTLESVRTRELWYNSIDVQYTYLSWKAQVKHLGG